MEDRNDLKQRYFELNQSYSKLSRIYRVIVFIVILVVLLSIGYILTIGLNILSKQMIKAYIICSAFGLTISLYVNEMLVLMFSKKLTSMYYEIFRLKGLIYQNIFSTKRVDQVEVNNVSLSNTRAENVKMVIGFVLLFLGLSGIITSFIILRNVTFIDFLIIIAISSWVFIYSIFLMNLKMIIKSLKHPTFSMLLLFGPIIIATVLFIEFKESWSTLIIIKEGILGIVFLSIYIYYRPGLESRKLIKENKDIFTYRSSQEYGVIRVLVNKKDDRAKIILSSDSKFSVVLEKKINDSEPFYELIKEESYNSLIQAKQKASVDIIKLYLEADGRSEVELKKRFGITDIDIKEVYELFSKNEYLKDKVSIDDKGEVIIINFHKYLDISISDDYCEYFNTHWHPGGYEDIYSFVDDLLNEQIIFYENKITRRKKQYPGYLLEKLMQRMGKKPCRLYSAKQIYIDN